MIEIKFRFMFEGCHYDAGFSGKIDEIVYFTLDDLIDGKLEKWYSENESGVLDYHEKAREQYTGLKDNHGKEIYEGDIVKIYEIGEFIKVPIIFKDGAFTISGRPFIKEIGVYNPLYEITGNIHESNK